MIELFALLVQKYPRSNLGLGVGCSGMVYVGFPQSLCEIPRIFALN
jgi:hypothetical protein